MNALILSKQIEKEGVCYYYDNLQSDRKESQKSFASCNSVNASIASNEFMFEWLYGSFKAPVFRFFFTRCC